MASVLAIVDDYQPFLDYLAAFLRTRGYDVQSYASGQAVVDAVRTGTVPDLVLLDVMMPGLDGLHTLQLLKAVVPALPVVMLSARNQTSTVIDAVRLGALDYLVKPDDPEGIAEMALEAAVKDALARLEAVKVLTSRHDAIPLPGRLARLHADVAAAFPTDVEVNDALRRFMRTHGEGV
jgi:DNA-binding response OmpR family regulator